MLLITNEIFEPDKKRKPRLPALLTGMVLQMFVRFTLLILVHNRSAKLST